MALRVKNTVSDENIRRALGCLMHEYAVDSIECVGEEKIIRIAPNEDADEFYEMLDKKGFVFVLGWDDDWDEEDNHGWGYNNCSLNLENNIPGLLCCFEVRRADNNRPRSG